MNLTRRQGWSRAWRIAAAAALALGGALTAVVPSPGAVAAPTADVVQVSAGLRHSCGLTSSGDIWCWGDNDRGQLGRGDVTSSATPVLVEGLPAMTSVAAGGAHTCALTEAGDVWCWGANGSGQLGDGTTEDRFTPVRTLVGGVTQLSTGRSHSCGFAARLTSEVQLLGVTAGGGTYRLVYQDDSVPTPPAAHTGAIAWNAGPAAIAAALQGLSPDWDVSAWPGSAPGTVAIAFDTGARAHDDVPALQVDGAGLKGTGAAAAVRVASDGAQQLVCWGSDASSQLGRGRITDAGLGLDALPNARQDSDGANSLAVDPVTGDLFVSDTSRRSLWRFTGDGAFVSTSGLLLDTPTALGVATVSDGGSAPGLKLYTATDLTRGPITRYDAQRPDLRDSRSLDAWDDPRVVPAAQRAACSCKVSAMAVDPGSGAVLAVVSGVIGSGPGTPFLRLVRISSDLSGVTRVVDYAAAFPGVDAVTDLAVGSDQADNPVLYALERPASGSSWKISLWDIGGDSLSLRTRFPVSPRDRAADPADATRCPARTISEPALVSGFWTRTTTTYSFDFGRLGAVADGDVGVITKPTAETTLTERYVKDPAAVPQVAADPATGEGAWATAPGSGPNPVADGAEDACVNVFQAGSQAAYGRLVDSYRGSPGSDTALGRDSSDLAATPDGRLLVVDTAHDRIQQFAGNGDVLTRWPGSEFSPYPVPSRPARAVLEELRGEVTGVAAGDSHTCISSKKSAGGGAGPVLCWGSDSAGQLGYVTNLDAAVPYVAPSFTDDSTSFAVEVKQPPGPVDPTSASDLEAGSVTAGSDHTCASDAAPAGSGTAAADGSVIYCWGDPQDGQLVSAAVKSYGKGTVVRTALEHRLLEAGGAHTCLVLTATDDVTCRGAAITDVQGLGDVSTLSAGARHACAVAAGEIRCWGADNAGQTGPLGTGSALVAPVPLVPRVAVEAPRSLDGAIRVVFRDAVDAVPRRALVVRDSEVTVQPTTMSCRAPGGVPVSCAAGPVRAVSLRLRGGVVAGETYVVSVNPSDDLVAGGRPVPATLVDIAAPRSVEETDLGPAYSWSTRRDASAYGRSVAAESAPGATATFGFRGGSITWFTATGPGQGVARVSIDGRPVRTVDNSAPRARARVPRVFAGLGPGRHSITIAVAGRHGARGRGTSVAVDAFGRSGAISRNPRVATTWGAATLPPAPGGTGPVSYVAAGTTGSSVSFRFRAAVQLEWRTVVGEDQGRADVFVDGRLAQRVDNHAVFGSGARNRPTSLAIPVPHAGVHDLRIVVVGAGKGRHLVAVDGFSVS